MRLLAIVAVLMWTSNALAGPDYRCTIANAVASTEKPENKMYVGRQFTVDRQSGVMAGALKNAYATDPQVIDYGSETNSYKVVTTMKQDQGVGAGSSVYALTINEYQTGARKPFLFLSNDDAFLGWCEHF